MQDTETRDLHRASTKERNWDFRQPTLVTECVRVESVSVMGVNVTGHLTSLALSTILVHLCAADVVVRVLMTHDLYLKLFIW